MKRRNHVRFLFNFDSLTDIVSNNVGILIILTVIIAIFSYSNSQLFPELAQTRKSSYKLVKIPWRYYSKQKSLIILFDGNRIFYVDEKTIFTKLLKTGLPKGENKISLEFPSYFVDIELISDEPEYSVKLRPIQLQGENVSEALSTNSFFQNFLKKNPSDRYYVFAFVRSDSFQSFYQIKEFLEEKKYNLGWSPVNEDDEFSYYFNQGNSITNALLPQ